jgi:myo-inositol 2-dehydrogenase/D-chiro-inositol 1-dehydrogenase
MKKTSIGIVGAGLIARDHANTLHRLPGVGGLVVHDADGGRAAALAAQCGGRVARGLREIVAASDLVWVCTPPFARTEALREACRQRKAIFCEKPLGLSARQCREVAAMVKRARVPFYMGQSGRFSSWFMKMKALVEDGAIGQLTRAWSTRLGWLDRKRAPAWRWNDRLSGGCVIELGVHEIDFIRWVGGDWKSVHAATSSRVVVPGRYQDTAVATGLLRGGAIAHLAVSWASPRYLWQRGIEGTRGSLFFDDAKPDVHLLRPGKKPVIFKGADWLDRKTGENMSLKAQAIAALRALRGGAPFGVALRDGLEAVRVAAAIRESAAHGRVVTL